MGRASRKGGSEEQNHSYIVEFYLHPQGSVKPFLCLKSVCLHEWCDYSGVGEGADGNRVRVRRRED